MHGDNTDFDGFRRAVCLFMDGSVRGIRVRVLGAGGAARAALVGLLDEGAGEVHLYNRTAERARAVARRIGGERARVVPTSSALDGEKFDLVVNTTRLGLEPNDPPALDLARLSRVGAAMDLVYGRDKTPFVRNAEGLGVRSTDGMEMLVQQGAASFERWWDRPAPIEAMRAAIRRSLAR